MRRYYVVAVVAICLALSFLPISLNAAQSVDSTIVNTATNPVPVAGTVQVTRPALRYGQATISLETGFERGVAIPPGVVLTDVHLDRYAFSTSDPVCDVWLYETIDNSRGALITLRPSAAQSTVELHLVSGIDAATGTEIGLIMNSDCRVNVFWSGYTK